MIVVDYSGCSLCLPMPHEWIIKINSPNLHTNGVQCTSHYRQEMYVWKVLVSRAMTTSCATKQCYTYTQVWKRCVENLSIYQAWLTGLILYTRIKSTLQNSITSVTQVSLSFHKVILVIAGNESRWSLCWCHSARIFDTDLIWHRIHSYQAQVINGSTI